MAEKAATRARQSTAEHGSEGESANGKAHTSRPKAAAPMAAKKEPNNNATAEEARFLAEYADNLSASTRRAKWIHTPDEQADRPGQTLVTRTREVIEHWADERGGRPATVPGTEHRGRAGVLRIVFNEIGNRRLQEIGWDEWFAVFEERNLVFLHQQQKRDGAPSNFFRLDSPFREDG